MRSFDGEALRAHDVEYELKVFPHDVHDSLLFHRWIEAFETSDDLLSRKLWNRSVATDGGSR